MPAAAATDMDAKLVRERGQATLQRADHAGRDARGMPVHAHHRAEGLEPERVGEAPQQLLAAIMMDDRFADHGAEAGHPIRQPFRHAPAMQREIGASSSARHRSSCESLLVRSKSTLPPNGAVRYRRAATQRMTRVAIKAFAASMKRENIAKSTRLFGRRERLVQGRRARRGKGE